MARASCDHRRRPRRPRPRGAADAAALPQALESSVVCRGVAPAGMPIAAALARLHQRRGRADALGRGGGRCRRSSASRGARELEDAAGAIAHQRGDRRGHQRRSASAPASCREKRGSACRAESASIQPCKQRHVRRRRPWPAAGWRRVRPRHVARAAAVSVRAFWRPYSLTGEVRRVGRHVRRGAVEHLVGRQEQRRRCRARPAVRSAPASA